MTAIEISTTPDNVVSLGAPSAPFKREVEITLTASERASYGESLARRKIERDHMVEAAKEEARRRKNAIADVASEINRLAAAVDTGKEFREVKVYRRLEGAHVVVRTVDGDVEVDRRVATIADQQIEIPGLDGDDDYSGYQSDEQEVPKMVTSSTGATVAVMGHEDEGEAPSGELPAAPKKKRGRGKKAAAS